METGMKINKNKVITGTLQIVVELVKLVNVVVKGLKDR